MAPSLSTAGWRKLRQNRQYSQTVWLIISAGNNDSCRVRLVLLCSCSEYAILASACIDQNRASQSAVPAVVDAGY